MKKDLSSHPTLRMILQSGDIPEILAPDFLALFLYPQRR